MERTNPIDSQASGTHSRSRLILGVLIFAYSVIALLYAWLTPPWQVPDEPAHYNYIRRLAEERRLPILEMGDYDQSYIDRLLEERFPESLPIDALEYEDHQPPLYYLLAVPVYLVCGGSLLSLRVFSILFGAGLIFLAYRIAADLYPGRPRIALGAAALVALLPQHTAMMAAVNNDAAAELLLAVVLWMAIRLAQGRLEGAGGRILLGVVLGLGLLTKVTAYYGLVVVLGALLLRWRAGRSGRIEGGPIRTAAWAMQILAPALLLASPWWIRNGIAYDWPDVLGLIRHGAVTLGQPRTAEWIAASGFLPWLERGVVFTFRSFWGQFGWMSVVMDFRVYQALALWTGMAALGGIWVWRASRARSQAEAKPRQEQGRELLALLFACALLGFLAYNTVLVQHQGRYLFPALIPIGVAFALGFDYLLRPAIARRGALVLAAGCVLLAGYGLLRGDLPGWLLFMTAAFALGLERASLLAECLRGVLFSLPYAALALLNLYALFACIAPMGG